MRKIHGGARVGALIALVAIVASGCLGDNDAFWRLNVYVHNATGETLYVNGDGIGENLLYLGPLTPKTGRSRFRLLSLRTLCVSELVCQQGLAWLVQLATEGTMESNS